MRQHSTRIFWFSPKTSNLSKGFGADSYECPVEELWGQTMGATDVGYIESKIGLFKGNDRYIWNDEVIAKHKCNECGKSQEWAKGNNYWTLWKEKQFYCEDAPLIFADERGWEEAALM